MKKFLSLFLALVMALSCFAINVSATNQPTLTQTEVTADETGWFDANFGRPLGNSFKRMFKMYNKISATGLSAEFTQTTFKPNQQLNILVETLNTTDEMKRNNDIILTFKPNDTADIGYSVLWYKYISKDSNPKKTTVSFVQSGPQAPTTEATYLMVIRSDDGGFKTNKNIKIESEKKTVLIKFDANLSALGLSENDLTKVSGMPANCEIVKGGNIQKALSARPTLPGYTFVGWQDTSKTTFELVTENTTFNTSTTLKAVWQKPISEALINKIIQIMGDGTVVVVK